jgi:hypothetical protein
MNQSIPCKQCNYKEGKSTTECTTVRKSKSLPVEQLTKKTHGTGNTERNPATESGECAESTGHVEPVHGRHPHVRDLHQAIGD